MSSIGFPLSRTGKIVVSVMSDAGNIVTPVTLNGLNVLNFQLSQLRGGACGARPRPQEQDRYQQFQHEEIQRSDSIKPDCDIAILVSNLRFARIESLIPRCSVRLEFSICRMPFAPRFELTKLEFRALDVAAPDVHGSAAGVDDRLMSGVVET